MARHRTTEQKLADAEAKLGQLREKARKEETRRKILIGSMMLSRAKSDHVVMQKLIHELDSWLVSQQDRRLFASFGIGNIQGLCNATLHPVWQKAGWALGTTLRQRDRYGNLITK